MSLIGLILTLVVVGVLLWLLNNGPDSQVQQQLDDKASEPKGGASFTEFTLNT